MDFCPFRGPDAPHALMKAYRERKQTLKCADYADLLLEVQKNRREGGGPPHAVCASARSQQERLAVAQIPHNSQTLVR